MSVVFDLNRTSMWVTNNEGCGRLNYDVKDNNAVFNDAKSTNEEDSFAPQDKISYFDIKGIDVTNCNFSDFCKVAKFAKTSFSAFDYDESLLNSYNNIFEENENSNFFQYFDEERLSCANRGDMHLYYAVQKIAQVAQNMMRIYQDGFEGNLTDNGYFIKDVFTDLSCTGFYGNYRLADCCYRFGQDSYELVVEFDRDSTKEKPVVNVSIGTSLSDKKLPGRYVVDINSIDLKNATPLELFAYYAYMDSLKNDKWYQSYNQNQTFTELFLSGAFEIESLSEFTDKQVNLLEVTQKAKEILLDKLDSERGEDINLGEIGKSYSRDLLKKWLMTYDEIIFSLGEDESQI
ncbi:hypothetical protein [Pseudobutyrivibrio sp.]|uniref:hypothetical protein n=1 Tax=Pseudobutyrivibrio sp. TaxID=2014367 RepID=UPI0025EEAAE8|nr:hypothetical protein [Pseudobutyrivibrio sp.]MBR5648591.1 hypothetical protein [Pseudobutyrivibrio sp.]